MIKEADIIRECLKLARKGTGYVSPNPMVGCIIMRGSEIIGRGYHKIFGGPHAEINAINDAKRKGLSLKGAVMYVNLEPCSHQGKTPPCTDAIIKEGIKKIYIGINDPNPIVNGKGISVLKKKGIIVKAGIIEDECRDFNKFYFKSIKHNLPYITLKIAQSLDGFIALENYESKWITGIKSRLYVQKLRNEYDAVLIGRNTCFIDNPSLDVKIKKYRNPYRIIIDRNLKLPQNLKIFSDSTADRTIIISALRHSHKRYNANIIQIKEQNGILPFTDIFRKLQEFGINSILVEGGSFVFSEIIKQKLFDDIILFIAPKIFGKGISVFPNFTVKKLRNSLNLNISTIKKVDRDILLKLKLN